MQNYLIHYGVLGMKWGVRRYQNKDGTLTDAGVKRYAKKGFAEDGYNMNKTNFGKAYDKITGAHKLYGDAMYDVSNKKQRRDRANKYVADKNKKANQKADLGKKFVDTAKDVLALTLADEIYCNCVCQL